MARKLKKGDTVVVISGKYRYIPNKRGMGKIIHVDTRKGRIIVEGVNVRKIARKRNAQQREGGFDERECSIHISNVMLLATFEARQNKRAQTEITPA